MSVPQGALTTELRARIVEFYGRVLGWAEIESLRLPDRMTLAVGGRTYVNVRERSEPMVCTGYEHLGVILSSSDDVDKLWSTLAHDDQDVNLEAMHRGEHGYRSFRFHHLLPLAIEVQYLP